MSLKSALGSIGDFLNPANGVMEGVKDIITTFKLPPEQAKEFEFKMLELKIKAEGEARAAALEQVKLFDAHVKELREQIKVELQSTDAYVRRQRPTWGYVTLGILVVNYCVFPLINEPIIDFPEWFWATVMGVNGLYFFLRSKFDKG